MAPWRLENRNRLMSAIAIQYAVKRVKLLHHECPILPLLQDKYRQILQKKKLGSAGLVFT